MALVNYNQQELMSSSHLNSSDLIFIFGRVLWESEWVTNIAT